MLDRIAAGELIYRVTADNGFTRSNVRAYLATTPTAQAEWDNARQESADAFFDKAIEIAYNPAIDAAHARTQIDTFKWASATRNPREYNPKQQIDLNVRTIDVTQTLIAAQSRLEASRALLPAIIGQAVRIDDQGGGGTDS